MKLFEKVKNMFTEEVEEEVKVEQVPSKQKREVAFSDSIDSFDDVKVEKEEIKKPVFFTDHDFEDMNNYQKNRFDDSFDKYNEPRKIEKRTDSERGAYSKSYLDTVDYRDDRDEEYKNVYGSNKKTSYTETYKEKEKKEERVFKPTPIISPVYGILDKNYHKDDIVTKKEVSYTPVDGLSVDTVRKKAYGTLEDELENTLFGSNSILFNNKDEEVNNDNFFGDLEEEARPDLLDNFNDDKPSSDEKIKDLEEITMDIGKELNSLLNKKETSKSRIESKKIEDDDLFDLIDNMYEEDSLDAD